MNIKTVYFPAANFISINKMRAYRMRNRNQNAFIQKNLFSLRHKFVTLGNIVNPRSFLQKRIVSFIFKSRNIQRRISAEKLKKRQRVCKVANPRIIKQVGFPGRNRSIVSIKSRCLNFKIYTKRLPGIFQNIRSTETTHILT